MPARPAMKLYTHLMEEYTVDDLERLFAMQTILGANGVIGREASLHLPQYSNRIRKVSRSPKPVNVTDELFSADLLDAKATADAVAGSEITYLVAGLKYDHPVWQEQWTVRSPCCPYAWGRR